MLMLLIPETIILEMTLAYRDKLARALKMPPSSVNITWEHASGSLRPVVDVALPPPLPPADLDVSDPDALKKWEQEMGDLPSLDDFLKAKGVDEPRKVINIYVMTLLGEIKKRTASAMRK